MKKPYKHLFFDLDHTLWDHHANANETLIELYHHFKLSEMTDFSPDSFTEAFHQVNHNLWNDYHLGKVDQYYIRQRRFSMVMSLLDTDDFNHSIELGVQYLHHCPRKSNLMPHAREILEYLSDKYPMSVITNGFDDVQLVKLSSCGIKQYFNSIVTSEKAGWLKPHRGIFNYAMHQAQMQARECLMIGDNPVTDIAGAQQLGMDQIYYDHQNSHEPVEATYQINSLLEIKDLL